MPLGSREILLPYLMMSENAFFASASKSLIQPLLHGSQTTLIFKSKDAFHSLISPVSGSINLQLYFGESRRRPIHALKMCSPVIGTASLPQKAHFLRGVTHAD